MSWASTLLSDAALAAGSELKPGPVRELAVEGVAALAPAIPVLESLGGKGLRRLAAGVNAGEPFAVALALEEDPELAELRRINSENLAQAKDEQETREQIAAVLEASRDAILVALPFVLAAAGL